MESGCRYEDLSFEGAYDSYKGAFQDAEYLMEQFGFGKKWNKKEGLNFTTYHLNDDCVRISEVELQGARSTREETALRVLKSIQKKTPEELRQMVLDATKDPLYETLRQIFTEDA